MLTVTLGHVAAFTSGVFYLIIEDVAWGKKSFKFK
jgi:hypothetical protein